MYIKLTPKQLSVLKKLLPTVKLNAYDIEIYQEIQKALAEPIDSINKSGPKKPDNTVRKPEPKKTPVKEQKIEPTQEYEEKDEYLESIKTDKRPQIKLDEQKEELEELDQNVDEDQESIFSVIDSRTQKTVL